MGGGRAGAGTVAARGRRGRDAGTIFGTATPPTVDSEDANSVVLGVKFSSEVAGRVTGVRFYKASHQHRHPHRQPVELERHAAGLGDVHR